MSEIIDIQILCPSKRCPKCDRLEKYFIKSLHKLNLKYNLKILNEIDEMIKFKTAILPAIFINSKLTFVGVPDERSIAEELRKLKNKNATRTNK